MSAFSISSYCLEAPRNRWSILMIMCLRQKRICFPLSYRGCVHVRVYVSVPMVACMTSFRKLMLVWNRGLLWLD
jgi:hypothetical protein